MVVRRKFRLVTTVAVSVAGLAFSSGIAGAGPAAHASRRAGAATAANAVPDKLPGGYTVVTSATIPVPAKKQTKGTVFCPSHTKRVGGGVYTDSSSALVSISSSYPWGFREWIVGVNNSSNAATTMTAYVVCIKQQSGAYTFNYTGFTAAAESQSQGTVTCPTGVVVGGGVRTYSGRPVSVAANLPSSTTAWTGWVSNAMTVGAPFVVWAICKNTPPPGYSLQGGGAVTNPAGQQTYSNVTCPGNSVPLSGGIDSAGSGVGQNMSSSAPFGQQWFNYFANNDPSENTIQTWAVCAGT